MGWVFDMELGVKRVPDLPDAIPPKREPVMFNGVDVDELAARYVAYRKAMNLNASVRNDGPEAS